MIEIEADEVEPLNVKLVGKMYQINPPKTAMSLAMAENMMGRADVFDMKNEEKLPKAEREKREKRRTKIAREAQRLLNDWVIQAFGAEGAKEIQARLADPTDKLDTPHLMKLMTAVSEEVTGNPTT